MTIIDANVYLGEWPFRKMRYNSIHGLMALMNRCGIDKAVISPLEGVFYHAKNLSAVNTGLATIIKENPDRWIPFYTINPGFPCWQDDLDYCKEDLKAEGIRLYPNYHGYSINSKQASDLIESSGRKGLPVNISVRFEDERVHHPLVKVPPIPIEELGEAISSFPNATFILSGIRLSEIETLKNKYKELKNYYIEISYIQTPFRCFERLVDLVGAEYVLFGTGMPYWYPEAALLKVKTGLVNDEVKKRVLGINLLDLFAKAKQGQV